MTNNSRVALIYDRFEKRSKEDNEKGREGSEQTRPLPVDNGWEELGDEPFVVRAELLDVALVIAFAVEVVRVERTDGLERLVVLFAHEMLIRGFTVPRVEAVEPDHRETLFGEGGLVLEDVIEVLTEVKIEDQKMK